MIFLLSSLFSQGRGVMKLLFKRAQKRTRLCCNENGFYPWLLNFTIHFLLVEKREKEQERERLNVRALFTVSAKKKKKKKNVHTSFSLSWLPSV